MMVKDFLDGFLAVFRGMLMILSSKRMMLLAALPVLIGILILIGGSWYFIPRYYLVHNYFLHFLSHLTQWLGDVSSNIFLQVGLHTATFLLILALLMAGVYAVFLLTKLLAAPFYSLLASQVLKKHGIFRARDLSLMRWLILSFRATAVNLVEIMVLMIAGALLFVFSFIPFLNILAGFGFFLVMAFDSTDYSLDVLHFDLRSRLQYFFSHLAQFCGFALAIALVMLIPVLNLILFAACVAGAADLVGRNSRGKL